jgi:hypothetical protein
MNTMNTEPVHISPAGSKAVVHVHQQKIRNGEPSIIVRRRGKSRHFTRVEIDGPVSVIHAEYPDSCGARVTIESWGEIRCYNDWSVEARQEAS